MRGAGTPMPPTDPLIYRFYELVMVNGPAWKALIEEEFGDGIMSAIDFDMTMERQADPKGDRVKIAHDRQVPAVQVLRRERATSRRWGIRRSRGAPNSASLTASWPGLSWPPRLAFGWPRLELASRDIAALPECLDIVICCERPAPGRADRSALFVVEAMDTGPPRFNVAGKLGKLLPVLG